MSKPAWFFISLFIGLKVQADDVSSLDLLTACHYHAYHIDLGAGTMQVVEPQQREDDLHNCPITSVAAVGRNQVAVLVDTLDDQTADYKAPFAIRFYAVPSWKLLGTRSLPGKYPYASHVVPGRDGKTIVFISQSDSEYKGHPLYAYRAERGLPIMSIAATRPLDLITSPDLDRFLQSTRRAEVLPYASKYDGVLSLKGAHRDQVPGATVFGIDLPGQRKPDYAIVRSGNRLTILHTDPLMGDNKLAETGDAVLFQFESEASTDANVVLTGKVAVFSADTGKQTNEMTVAALEEKDTKCVALWHDKVAVFQSPKAFVIVDFMKKTSKVVSYGQKLERPPYLFPVWVEMMKLSTSAKGPGQ